MIAARCATGAGNERSGVDARTHGCWRELRVREQGSQRRGLARSHLPFALGLQGCRRSSLGVPSWALGGTLHGECASCTGSTGYRTGQDRTSVAAKGAAEKVREGR